jgi:uncharacterized spore protein YtfJ
MAEDKDKATAGNEGQSSTRSIDIIDTTMERFFDTAGVDKVYGRPIKEGETTILPAAEVMVAAGFGSGFGKGTGETEESEVGSGEGGGGGGGGKTLSRPVAVVISSPEGVRVEPVIDFTKVALAAITAWGFMATMVLRMRKGKGS